MVIRAKQLNLATSESFHYPTCHKAKQKPYAKAKKRKITLNLPPEESTTSIKRPVKIIFKRQTELDKHLDNLNAVLYGSNATPIGRYGGVGYACCYCEKEYPTPNELKEHTLQTHDNIDRTYILSTRSLQQFKVNLDITGLRCRLCDLPFATLDELTNHLSTDHGKKYHTDIKSHVIPFKFDSLFNCVICQMEFKNFKNLLIHMNVHFRNFVCDICGQGFVNQKMFSSHMYRHKTGIFNCSFCNKTFDSRIKCKDHERATHKMNNMRSKCGYCGERFTDYAKKNDHVVKVHGAKPLVLNCVGCSKTFDNQRALNSHTKHHHLLEKRFKHM